MATRTEYRPLGLAPPQDRGTDRGGNGRRDEAGRCPEEDGPPGPLDQVETSRDTSKKTDCRSCHSEPRQEWVVYRAAKVTDNSGYGPGEWPEEGPDKDGSDCVSEDRELRCVYDKPSDPVDCRADHQGCDKEERSTSRPVPVKRPQFPHWQSDQAVGANVTM